MKKMAYGLILLLITLQGFSQSNASDNNIPIIINPPDTPCIKKLIGFSLPCCIDTTKNVKDIATLLFDNPTCPNTPSVTFSPAKLSPSKVFPVDQVTVTASANGQQFTSTILVVNSNIGEGISPVGVNFDAIAKYFDNIRDAAANGGVAPCKASGSLIPTGAITVEQTTLCCTGSKPCTKKGKKYGGNVSWSYGTTCHIPVFGVPYIASLDLVWSAQVGASIGINRQVGCTDQKICVNGNGSFTIGGGVGATVLSGAVSADLQVSATAGLSVEYCFEPPPRKGTANISAGPVMLTGTVYIFWGISSHSVSAVLIDQVSYGPFNF